MQYLSAQEDHNSSPHCWPAEHITLISCCYVIKPSCCCLFIHLCPTWQHHRLYSPPGSCQWNFPGKITGVGCHFLLQGIFLTQGSNMCLHISCIAGGFFTTEPLGKLIKPSIYLEKLVAFMEKKNQTLHKLDIKYYVTSYLRKTDQTKKFSLS